VKYFSQLSPLSIALTVSVLLHGALLTVRFVAPEAFQLKPADPGLEVILVNAKHKKPPVKAEALAQANLDGGGNADAGRSKSPLPDLHRNDAGESVQATQRRIAELEEAQKNLLSQTKKSLYSAKPVNDKDKPDPSRTGADLIESSKALARSAAEITQRIEDENKRPRKTFITPSTREVGYAMYYKDMQKRVEEIGTLNFPQRNGKKMYGELVVYIPIFQDGTIYQKDGGVRVEKSSGNPELDKAALAIVRRAAPFGRFPPKMLSSDKDDLWVIITRFKFTREEKLEAELRGQ
jgi:periplasmic protein TonB